MFEHDQHLNFAVFLLNLSPFQEVAKLLKLNHVLKKYDRSSKFSTGFNRVFEENYTKNTCLEHLTDKITTVLEKASYLE